MYKIKLNLTENQFAVIYEFLYHTKLGDKNKWTTAVSDLIRDMEFDGVNDLLAEIDMPKIMVTFSEDEGMVFDLE